ncbi:hypothetical protein [Rhizobium sp. 'Codium 1']|uniref:hypothetical protein n=1 Tax=Rhizobium sp. 'Codium 1' TaxID=2940484 RepID=UPI001E4387A3|nr:hypothetical protein [Rhizobium sp. 'Codium 1']MCC8931088.1 hypothetical protein [Rhizobium sp. 'Codium 1']
MSSAFRPGQPGIASHLLAAAALLSHPLSSKASALCDDVFGNFARAERGRQTPLIPSYGVAILTGTAVGADAALCSTCVP